MCRMINNTNDAIRSNTLLIKLEAEILTSANLRTTLEAARKNLGANAVQNIIFDFSDVKQIGPQWTVVWAMIIDFGRTMNVACHVESLAGQPAATASLFRRSREITSMIAPTTLRPAA